MFALLMLSATLALDRLVTAYEGWVQEANVAVINYLRTGTFAVRKFDVAGIPTSIIPSTGESVISPFYVVHYGLLYSEHLVGQPAYRFLWECNSSQARWNVPVDLSRGDADRKFARAVEWLTANLKKDEFGNSHYFYGFDWHYPRHTLAVLPAPWYSGLTDAHAMNVFLRAYAATGKESHLRLAAELYKSVLTPVAGGGSTIRTVHGPWIEEYVDSRLADEEQSRVLNGMIYAAFAVHNYERMVKAEPAMSAALFEAIKRSLSSYDLRGWTYYDAIGTLSNPKYHAIHVALMNDLACVTGDRTFSEYAATWERHGHTFLSRIVSLRQLNRLNMLVLVELLLLAGAIAALLTLAWTARAASGTHA